MKYETILPTEASRPGGSDDYPLCIMYRMLFMYVHEYLQKTIPLQPRTAYSTS